MDEVKETERRMRKKGAIEGKTLLLLQRMAEILPDNATSKVKLLFSSLCECVCIWAVENVHLWIVSSRSKISGCLDRVSVLPGYHGSSSTQPSFHHRIVCLNAVWHGPLFCPSVVKSQWTEGVWRGSGREKNGGEGEENKEEQWWKGGGGKKKRKETRWGQELRGEKKYLKRKVRKRLRVRGNMQ